MAEFDETEWLLLYAGFAMKAFLSNEATSRGTMAHRAVAAAEAFAIAEIMIGEAKACLAAREKDPRSANATT